METLRDEWLTVKGRAIGPELQSGHIMGHVLDEPVLVLKACIGNRSLGWDLLPPGSERLTVDGTTYAGYKDTPSSWVEGQPKKHPEFAGNVKTVESRDFWREADVSPANQGYHYNRNAETYMEVGNALGWAMADLLERRNQ